MDSYSFCTNCAGSCVGVTEVAAEGQETVYELANTQDGSNRYEAHELTEFAVGWLQAHAPEKLVPAADAAAQAVEV
jgi:hypothetical protein